VGQEWTALKERTDMPLEHLAQGLDWRVCVALLTLHAMADEACAGLGIALDTSDALACVYRARGREMLVRTGSLARIDARLLRVLPKVRTPPTGRPAFSRYACVRRPGIEVRWHKMPARHRGTDLRSEYATLLLLPWPLEVKASDFRPVEGSVQRLSKDPFGFFEFAQYHLGGVLHPHVRWWESMEVPRRSIEFVEVAELTLAALVCEDLAQNDDVAELIRQVGPTCVITLLLDGPQLDSRWAARYASVLADDPGSAVMTLTSYGMVQRSRPRGRAASSVVALWKDPSTGVHEIPLEAGAHGVLLTICMDRATRRSADGRIPVDNGTHAFDVTIHQVRASPTGSPSPRSAVGQAAPHVLESEELTVLTAWAEAVVEAMTHAPERAAQVLAEGRPGAQWRAAMGLPEPSGRFGAAIASMEQAVGALDLSDGKATSDALLAAAAADSPDEDPIDGLVRRVLLAMFEERCTRRPDSTLAQGARA
jgi:hypothetical protein